MLETEIKKPRRGRPSPKDQTENDDNFQSSVQKFTTISDPILEPFYIEYDSGCFTVMVKAISTRGFAGKKASGIEKSKVVGYYTSFKNALNVIARDKFYQNKTSYSSIKEYMNDWTILKEGVDQIINKLEI
jgi:hypothetical protein